MGQILILYSTTDGHTVRICDRLRAVVEAGGSRATVKPLAEGTADDLARCDAVVIGASIRYGKHKPEVGAFIARHQAALEAKPNALFSVNVVARKPGKDVPEANPYLLKFLRRIAWKPQRLAVFAGRIDYPSYGALDRTMIRFIMWMTKGPTDPKAVVEFTDWARVDAFGSQLLGMVPAAPSSATAAA
ncbi:MAG: menaquinone-dependent protoporphyrinogen IX dehydrogenase [Rubrivivax sp.]|nr:menaquinone-dependent protoporphyrinogen IX dehydrogenase [Rubrivivax sp.]